MTLRILTPEELRLAYETDLREAFPPSELKPLAAMESLRRRGVYDPLGAFGEAGEVLGYALLWKHREGRYMLIDYLCVPAGKRGGGIGGRIIQAVREHYPPDTVLLGESEAPTGDPDRDEIILRRLAFYRRTGAVTLGYDCALFGVHFKDICWGSPMPEEAEILRRHQEIYLDQFGQARYDQYIQLPLAPGEAVRPVTDWTEDV